MVSLTLYQALTAELKPLPGMKDLPNGRPAGKRKDDGKVDSKAFDEVSIVESTPIPAILPTILQTCLHVDPLSCTKTGLPMKVLCPR